VSNAAGTIKRTTENLVCHRACSPINGVAFKRGPNVPLQPPAENGEESV
jgi:hypothetical protein